MTWTDTLTRDVWFAVRSLVRLPLFAAAAILTLALGIATTTAMFTIVDGVVLRPLPYPHSERLFELLQSYPEKNLDRWTLSQANAAGYMGVKSFEGFAAYARTGVTLEENEHADRLIAEVVTGDFFTLLGVQPALGRAIGRDDDRTGNTNVAVLSHSFWQTRYGGSPALIGRTIRLNGQPTRVVGVMPADFAFPKPDVQVYVPLGLDPNRSGPNFLTGLIRLRAEISAGQAEREATLAMWDFARRTPEQFGGVAPERTRMRALVTPLRTAVAGSVTRPLLILQAAVVLILLIAIANVATLIGTRGISRGREIALRAALGASRRRIVGQMITESLVLAVAAGGIGVVAALALVRAFTRSSLATLPRLGEVSLDWRVLLFASVVSAIAGLLFALAPVFVLDLGRLNAALSGQKASASRNSRRLNSALIAGQVGLSFVLLIAAGLVLKSFRRLLDTDLGFDPARVMSITMPLPGARYAMSNKPRSYLFVEQVVAKAATIPEVGAAAVMFPGMYVNDVNSDGFLLEGQDPSPNAPVKQTVQYSVSPGLFRVLRVPLLAGRDFTADDRIESPWVVVVDQALIAGHWDASSAIGNRIRMTGDTTWRTIVGVVGNIRDEGVADAPRPHTYFPYSQYGGSRPSLVLRSDDASSRVVAAARVAISAVDPAVPIDNPHPIASAIDGSLATRRLTELLLVGFAGLALVLAAGGLYGVMSLFVVSRRREFGIRAAIGADPGSLVRVVVGEGAALVGAGIAMGFVASMGAGRSLRSTLYEVTPTDSVVYVAVASVLVLVASIACYVPARRAANTDPLVVLRAD
ncbi:MAG TPA: ABC transporter permease [Gemmatimonadaceae bacterium]|nr:ABC transporter permease [Gemmatimonadaceae bacterium]